MIFAGFALLMLLAAAASVGVPLWRGARATASADTADATHRLQLEELEWDLAAGVLAKADHQVARRDMQAEWVTSDKPGRKVREASKGWRRGSALAAALFILLLAPVLYWYYGNWRSGAEGVEQASIPAVEQMVADLSVKLHGTDGDDLEGWVMLGHAYVIMERYPDAVDAYSHAYKLAGDSHAEVLAGYGEAMTLANPDDFMSKAVPLFEKALQLDPANPQALWYGGLGALERGDKHLAVERWQTLLNQDPPVEYRRVIEKYIVDAGGSVGAAVTKAPAVAIHVHVILSPGLQARVQPDETLFVFAVPQGGAGGPPLAARRFQAHSLPLDITLTDQDSPIAGRSLSGQTHVTVMARISLSGTPEQHAGDLVGQADWDPASGKPLNIVIDTVVK